MLDSRTGGLGIGKVPIYTISLLCLSNKLLHAQRSCSSTLEQATKISNFNLMEDIEIQ